MTSTTSPAPAADRLEAERLVREQFRIIETGDLALAEANVTPDFINHRSVHEPLAARGRGPRRAQGHRDLASAQALAAGEPKPDRRALCFFDPGTACPYATCCGRHPTGARSARCRRVLMTRARWSRESSPR